ncbi:MAG: V-type ATPase subunit [Clostridiales bacterium]|nr:V-type ATPase subunit [Clostridiales bacterium]
MARKVKIKDTDYLFISAYVHAKGAKLIGNEQLMRMLEAKSAEDAYKVLEENGWPLAGTLDAGHLAQILAERREEAFSDMASLAPNPKIVDLFRIRYDYHNAKVLIKSQAKGIKENELLLGSGRFSPKKLNEIVLEERYQELPKTFADAYIDALDTLSRTGDPQISDFILDRAYFEEYLVSARETGSRFLTDYARLTIDSYNLKAVVRSARMKKDGNFLKQALAPGGTVPVAEIFDAYISVDMAIALFRKTALRKILDLAEEAVKGGRLTEFERLTDSVSAIFLADAKTEGFNEKPLIRYLFAVEAEISAVRIIMAGQFSGLPAETVRKRLREGL